MFPSVFPSLYISICLSGLQVCCLDFIPAAFYSQPAQNLPTVQQAPAPHRIARTYTHVDSARETSVCARCGFLCFSDETDQQLRAIRTLFIKLQTPSLLDYFCQERFVQTCCEISADVVVICLFTWCVLFRITMLSSFLMGMIHFSSLPSAVL